MNHYLSLIIVGVLFVAGVLLPLLYAYLHGGRYFALPGRGELESTWSRSTVPDPRDLQR